MKSFKTLNGNLTAAEEETVQNTLNVIGERVRKFKLQLFTYFKDFDRVKLKILKNKIYFILFYYIIKEYSIYKKCH